MTDFPQPVSSRKLHGRAALWHLRQARNHLFVALDRLLESGFGFQFPTWPEAARDLCQRWRAAGRSAQP